MSNTNKNGVWYETQVAKEIVSKKYFHENESTFEQFADRVSSIFSDKIRPQVKQAMYDADFFVAGRSLYGAGSKGKFNSTMSNCYILPMMQDNIEDIFDVNKKMARIFSYGGGCGVNISNLRPKGARVQNSAKTSTGSVSFMNILDSVGCVIGANNRRAALMIGLNCEHPDIEEFMKIKQNNTAIQAANISILFNDDFMQTVKENKEYELYFKVEATGEEIRKKINAREFFMEFAEAANDYAEPGCIYIDNVRNYNLLSGYPKEIYSIDICNP